MKPILSAWLTLAAVCLGGGLAAARGGTTIDAANHCAYAANLGWLDWRGDTNNGAVIGEYVCSGYLYSANAGWINLGSGAPTNGIYYLNTAAADFGVNHDGRGNLTGYAWGANIGWIAFEATGAPKVDLLTGNLSGAVWSANCGWISLSNAVAWVQTDAIQKGALAPNGLPIAWLLQNFGTTNVDAGADPDGDGASNASEYLAGTDPTSPRDVLKITSFQRGVLAPRYNQLIWNSTLSRFYAVQASTNLANPDGWADYLYYNYPGVSGTGFFDYTATNRFYRVRAYRPLTP